VFVAWKVVPTLFLYKCTYGCTFESQFADCQTSDSWQLIALMMVMCLLCVLLPLASIYIPSAEPG